MEQLLKPQLDTHRHSITLMKHFNAKYEETEKRILDGVETQKALAHHTQILKDILHTLTEQRSLYKDSMLATLEKAVKESIALVSPTKQYDVKLTTTVFRNKNVLRLRLIDKKGRLLPPKIIEGDMLNQVLSFATIALVSFQLGYRWVYYDEAFPSANARSLVLIRELIRNLNQMGMRFVFVTQNPIVLAGLNHHVVELVAEDNHVSDVIEYEVQEVNFDEETDDKLIEMLDLITRGGSLNEEQDNNYEGKSDS